MFGSAARGDFPLVADKRAACCPAGSWPRCVVLPGFAVSGVPGGVSRGYSGRGARGGSVVRLLPRAALYEVGEDARMAVGSSMLATIRSAPPQWPQGAHVDVAAVSRPTAQGIANVSVLVAMTRGTH